MHGRCQGKQACCTHGECRGAVSCVVVQDGGATAALVSERDRLQADLRIASDALRETVDRLELYQVQRLQMEAALRRFDTRLVERDRCGPCSYCSTCQGCVPGGGVNHRPCVEQAATANVPPVGTSTQSSSKLQTDLMIGVVCKYETLKRDKLGLNPYSVRAHHLI